MTAHPDPQPTEPGRPASSYLVPVLAAFVTVLTMAVVGCTHHYRPPQLAASDLLQMPVGDAVADAPIGSGSADQGRPGGPVEIGQRTWHLRSGGEERAAAEVLLAFDRQGMRLTDIGCSDGVAALGTVRLGQEAVSFSVSAKDRTLVVFLTRPSEPAPWMPAPADPGPHHVDRTCSSALLTLGDVRYPA